MDYIITAKYVEAHEYVGTNFYVESADSMKTVGLLSQKRAHFMFVASVKVDELLKAGPLTFRGNVIP